MNLDYINPLTKENLGWVVATLLALRSYPRLAAALGKTAVYVGLTPLRETAAITKIFYQELSKPKAQVKPIVTKKTATNIVRSGSRLLAANPKTAIAVGGALAVAATTAGMVKQNPPPEIAFMRVPV